MAGKLDESPKKRLVSENHIGEIFGKLRVAAVDRSNHGIIPPDICRPSEDLFEGHRFDAVPKRPLVGLFFGDRQIQARDFYSPKRRAMMVDCVPVDAEPQRMKV